MAVSLDWSGLLSYTIVTLCVIFQTVVLGASKDTSTSGEKSGLLVASSALVMISWSIRMVVIFLHRRTLMQLFLFELPGGLAFLSAVLSLAVPATRVFTLSLTASVLTGVTTFLTWTLSISHLQSSGTWQLGLRDAPSVSATSTDFLRAAAA